MNRLLFERHKIMFFELYCNNDNDDKWVVCIHDFQCFNTDYEVITVMFCLYETKFLKTVTIQKYVFVHLPVV